MPQFNQDLVDDLANQRVVLFVGSGVSASALTRAGSRLCTWEAFLTKNLVKIDDSSQRDLIGQYISSRDYLFAAELLKDALGEHRWSDSIAEEYLQVADPSQLQKALIQLDQKIIVTTNYDKLLEDAWSSVKTEARRFPRVINRMNGEIFTVFRSPEYHIIKIHGSIDDASHITMSREEYVKNAFGNLHYQEFLKTCLLTHTVLFVGFSMADPAITLLVEILAAAYPSCRPHYIFLGGPQPSQIVELSKRMRKLSIIEYDTSNDHAQLVEAINSLREAARERRKIITAENLRSAIG